MFLSFNNFSNRLAFPNKDRILLGGLNDTFRENSVIISDCRAFSPLKTAPASLATDFLNVENIVISWYA